MAVGLELEGELVDPREITSLLGDKVNVRRSKEQVIAAVSHRIDCKETHCWGLLVRTR